VQEQVLVQILLQAWVLEQVQEQILQQAWVLEQVLGLLNVINVVVDVLYRYLLILFRRLLR
jgi:hypothetical protein